MKPVMVTVQAPPEPAPAPDPPARPVAAPARWTLRAVITLHAMAAFAQALFAGRFLSGDYESLSLHFDNSQVVGALAIAQVVVGFLYWRPGGGRLWPALVAVGMLAVEPIQIAAGILRIVGIHIPLGVAIITGSVLFTVWVWGSGSARRRTTVGSGR